MPAVKRSHGQARRYRYEMSGGDGWEDVCGEVEATSHDEAWQKLPWAEWPLGTYQVRLYMEVETVQVSTRKQPVLSGPQGYREVKVEPLLLEAEDHG